MKPKYLFLALATIVAKVSDAQHLLYPNTFDLGQVTLLESPFKHAQDLNVATLLQYDTDRLLAPFLKTAGLEPKGESFDNWIGLDGHVGGHYMTALAIHYASTGNEECLKRLNYMIDELERAQNAAGDGYVGGVERKCWQRVASGDVQAVWEYWVPWYNLHKTLAGLRDAYVYAGNQKALSMYLRLCDWCLGVIANLDDNQMEAMLANEFGGMDEVLADAYALSGNLDYLNAAKRFSHHWLLDSMVQNVDNLDNKHANTQVPKVVGYQRIAELCAQAGQQEDAELYRKAAENFWRMVVEDRSLAFGGNSRREHFASADDCISYVEEREGPESCNTNNMLKLTEGLYRIGKANHVSYADYYERALMNHILSTQHPEHGGYVYFTSARPAHYRVYSTPNSAMWCCVGTGMENHGKYGEFIYTHNGKDNLQVNLYVPSVLNWKEAGTKLRQEVSTNAEEKTMQSTITIEKASSAPLTLQIRKPAWSKDMSINVNGKPAIEGKEKDAGYASINRKWKAGDKIEIIMPMDIRLEPMPNLPQYQAIMMGPWLMGTRMGTADMDGLLSDDGRWAHIAHGALRSLFDAPFMIGEKDKIKQSLEDMKVVDASHLTYAVDDIFTIPNQNADGKKQSIVLEPFAGIHDCRYCIYWPTMTTVEYAAFQDAARAREAKRLKLDAITVDAVATAEQQPEVDHAMKQNGSYVGNSHGEAWRAARGNNYFEYTLDTSGRTDLKLMLRIGKTDASDMDILIDGIAIDQSTLAWDDEENYANRTYDIPMAALEGKQQVTLRFQPRNNSDTGRISHIRLIQ